MVGRPSLATYTAGGIAMNSDINPMQSAHNAQRCSATSKRTGQPCRAPAVKGFSVCRMHGARGGAPKGVGNGRYSHGLRSEFYTTLFEENRRLNRQVREAINDLL